MIKKHFIWKDASGWLIAAISVDQVGYEAHFGIHRMVENVNSFLRALIKQPGGPTAVQRNKQGCLQWSLDLPWGEEIDYEALTKPFVDLLGAEPLEIDHNAYQQFTYATKVVIAFSVKAALGVQGRILGPTGMETLPNGQKIPTIQVDLTGTSQYVFLRVDEFIVVE